MGHTFSDEAREFEGGGQGNWFDFGVHEVTIGEVTEGTTDSGTDFIEFTLLGDNQEEDTARVWLTEKSEKYSFATLRGIYTHCAPEKKKDEARDSFDKAPDSTAVVELLQNCIGKKIWFTKYPDPKRTYQSQSGETKQSINKNIYGYEPKPRTDLVPAKDKVVDVDTDKPITAADLGGEAADGEAAANIPEKW